MSESLIVALVGATALSVSWIVWCMTRRMLLAGHGSDGETQINAAAHSHEWRWPSDMHAYALGKAWMKDAGVLGVAVFQRVLKDRQGPAPLTAVALVAHAISTVLLYVALRTYWNTPVALWVVALYLTSFWPYQIVLLGGFQGLAQMFLLGAVVCLQRAHTGSLAHAVWYVAAGSLSGGMMFSSASGRKFLLMVIGALWFSQREALAPLGITADGWASLTQGLGLVLVTLVGVLALGLVWVAARRATLFHQLVTAIYFQRTRWLNGLIHARDRMPLESYLNKGRVVIPVVIGVGVGLVGYLALCVTLSRASSFYIAHALVVLGFSMAVLFFTYPRVIWNLKGYLSYWQAAALWSHYPLFAQMLARLGAPVKPHMRAPDVPWLIRFFWRQVPFHCLLSLLSLFAIVAGLVLQGWKPFQIACAVSIILLSVSPLIYGSLTKSPLCSRPYFPAFLGLLMLIGYGAFQVERLLPDPVRTGWWSMALGIAVVGAAWNLWVFLDDLWPARMSAAWLRDTLQAKGIRIFHTYDTPYNNVFVHVFPPSLRAQFTIRYLKALHEVRDGYIVVPETSSKSFTMSSDDYAATIGDFSEDPELTALIESRQITRYAVASFKTFGTSRFWGHEHDVISYREFFLKNVTERDRWRGRAWILDAKQLAEARALQEAAQGSPDAMGARQSAGSLAASRAPVGGMIPIVKRLMPESIKQPLRALRGRIQGTLLRRGVIREHLSVEALNRIFRLHRYWYLATYADDQLITRHNCDFLTSERFHTAYEFALAFTPKDPPPPWRNYLIQWAVRRAVAVEGDVVECGTARGFTAASILSVVDLSRLGKHLYLFDSWSGLLPAQLTAYERTVLYGNRVGEVNQHYSGFYDQVQEAFSRFPCVTLVKGYIPDTLGQQEVRAVCFLHIDMNAVYPEVKALRYFWPRLSKGAWVILDDYAQRGREEQKRGMDALAEELGFEIFSCPTGQGMIVK